MTQATLIRKLDLVEEGEATFSSDGRYRYMLSRRWGPGPLWVWIMLNPSTADADKLDPTCRRCASFTRAGGGGGMVVVNLFALRATNPKALVREVDPVGPENDAAILHAAQEAHTVVCAWGAHRTTPPRAQAVLSLLRGIPLWCLGVTVDGSPRHPLYVPAAQHFMPWPFLGRGPYERNR